MKFFLTKKKLILLVAGVVFLCLYFFSLPQNLFNDPYCTVLEDRSGQLLAAAIASDGQWRFPENTEVPEKFSKAITAYEDKRFWDHPGVDAFALGRAVRQNIQAGHVVSGGSTLTMQVVRLSRQNPPRTVLQKIIEIILSTRLELHYSKREILNLYASHAPFGGNVVGLEAACWRYFGRNSQELSWGEAALLAVLPNNPALIHLARNRQRLREKRNLLLEKLFRKGDLDATSYQLALSEPVPERPQALPRLATHLLDRVMQEGHTGHLVRSSIERGLQVRIEEAVEDYSQKLNANRIFNAAVVVVDVKTGEARAYVGNTKSGFDHQERVDVVRSLRSTGSILKPFLFAALLDEGKILPHTLIPDIPILISGFAPKNFSKQYDGVVSADQALVRSLNIPAVVELQDYRYEKFYDLLQSIGMTTLTKPADYYGLSLVLGGAEGTLWEITGMYASAARTLNRYFDHPGKNRYNKNDFHPPVYLITRPDSESVGKEDSTEPNSMLSASSLWLTFEVLKELYRPGEETGWRHFNSSKTIAWKTGTSFGFRDGWAVGVNPAFAVGVWVGNADGEGRPGLTGIESAAPLLFEIFSFLQNSSWFQKPQSELAEVPVCSLSGQRASPRCEKTETMAIPFAGLSSAMCRYHQTVHLSSDGKHRVHRDCVTQGEMKTVSWFVLPPVQEYYFKSKNLSYRPLPAYQKGCADPTSIVSMDLLYPKVNSKIYLPIELDGQHGSAVFEATHRNSVAVVYWHLDGRFIGSTQKAHHFSLAPSLGKHLLTLVDDSGETLQRSFEVISGR